MLTEATIEVGGDSGIQAFVIAFDDVDGPGHGRMNKEKSELEYSARASKPGRPRFSDTKKAPCGALIDGAQGRNRTTDTRIFNPGRAWLSG